QTTHPLVAQRGMGCIHIPLPVLVARSNKSGTWVAWWSVWVERYTCFMPLSNVSVHLDDDCRHVVEMRPASAEIADRGVKGIDDFSGALAAIGSDGVENSGDAEDGVVGCTSFPDSIGQQQGQVAR